MSLTRRCATSSNRSVPYQIEAVYASAELGCFLALGWPMPARLSDLFAEFRVTTNGRRLPCGVGLLGAMVWSGLDSMASDEKEKMRDLALRGGPWSDAEQVALLDYCEADVNALALLLPRMLPGTGRSGLCSGGDCMWRRSSSRAA